MMGVPETATMQRGMNSTLSYSTSCMSEFFDAREYINSDEDTEEEEVDDCESTASKSDTEDEQTFHEADTDNKSPHTSDGANNLSPSSAQGIVDTFTGRRRELPVPLTEM